MVRWHDNQAFRNIALKTNFKQHLRDYISTFHEGVSPTVFSKKKTFHEKELLLQEIESQKKKDMVLKLAE
jgi:predicted Zn-dependent peptidase